jgi:hypothetical protein
LSPHFGAPYVKQPVVDRAGEAAACLLLQAMYIDREPDSVGTVGAFVGVRVSSDC